MTEAFFCDNITVNVVLLERIMKNERQRKIIAAILLGVALLLVTAVGIVVGRPLVRYISEPERFRSWVDTHGALGPLAYVVIVIFQVVIALIPGEPFEILGGYAFGAVEGTVLCFIAAGVGSICVFWLVRRFGMAFVRVFFSQEKLDGARFLRSSPRRDLLFLIVFMLPGTPKDLLSYFAGLTDIRFGTWALICTVGRIPSIVSSTVGGSALGEKNYIAAAGVFAASFALSAAGMLVYKALSERRTKKRAVASSISNSKEPEKK